MEILRDFISLSYKITADGDCSHEIKRRLLFGRKAMTNLDSILKNRDIILPTKVHLVKAMVFPVVMYGCENWTIKKAESERKWSHSVVSNSFWPHGLQCSRLPCPSQSPRACSNSCPLSQWCHPAVSSSCPLLLLPSIFPSLKVFSNESAYHISIGASASTTAPPMNIQDWFPSHIHTWLLEKP